ncbi:oligosaccharide flippase family protein [Allisonella histaminiformans]|uniref:oligosaccharide flippase family protein n=1 Tax=Allisonella histaminiformans TaxID=209880 RepID=UPI002E7A63EB|nr:oligosaccharide flippase family protein [Allisonella histaminiformans]
MNQRKLGILLSYFNISLQVLIGFLYVPILLHFIGKSEYGLYQLMGSLIAYFSIMDFGLSAAVIRFYAKYKALKDHIGMENILAISVRGYGAVTILALAIGFICYRFLDVIFAGSMTLLEVNEAKQIFLLLLLNIVITLSTMVFRSVINAHERFFFLKGMETIQLIMQPILVVLVLQHHPNAFSVAAVQTLLNFLLSGARVYYCLYDLHIKIHFHYWNHELFSEFKKLALSVFAVSLIDQVFWKTNQIILGIISGTTAVAIYSIASLIYMNYMALSTAISGVYLPHVTGMVARKEPIGKLSELFIQIGRWQYYLLALVATGFIIFGKQFISLWAGPGFEDSYIITLLIIIPFTVDLIQNIGQAILQAMNRYDFRARTYLLTGILNLILAIPLGTRYGGIGCAVATGISMIVGNGFIMNWYYSKEIHLAIISFWKQIGKISFVVIGCLVVGGLINLYLWPRGNILFFGLKILGYTIMYISAIYWIAMNQTEKNKINQILMKFHIS